METCQLGRTELTVSRLGFGGAPAGLTNYLGTYTPDDKQHRGQVIAALETAVDLGITYFDTAADYGDGASEQIFGEVLADVSSEIVLATKVSNRMDVRASIERSLKNLRRDYLDVIQIHGTVYESDQADVILREGGLLDQLLALKAEGLVRFIGFTSEANNPAVYRFIADGRFDVMQLAYNFLHQHPYDPTRPFGSLIKAAEQKMGIITMRTLTSGLLQKWIQQINPTNDFDYTPALLQFVLSNPLVNIALVGMRTPEEVKANVQICQDVSGRLDLKTLHQRYI
ncbi:MAG: aldo/keto reductase [Chloroflexota bacterium]